MKKFLAALIIYVLTAPACSTVKNILSEQDAEQAIREALSIGANVGGSLLGKKGAFTKETIIQTLFPPELQKALSTLETLGLSKEVERLTVTLGTAAEKTAERSIPVFLLGIKNMRLKDAVGIVKNGGSAATDYLRASIGDTLRRSITPVMREALEEYKLVTEWDKLTQPVKLFAGDKLNLDIASLMSGLVANKMFNKIEEKEIEIRTRAEARTSAALQKVFGRVWK